MDFINLVLPLKNVDFRWLSSILFRYEKYFRVLFFANRKPCWRSRIIIECAGRDRRSNVLHVDYAAMRKCNEHYMEPACVLFYFFSANLNGNPKLWFPGDFSPNCIACHSVLNSGMCLCFQFMQWIDFPHDSTEARNEQIPVSGFWHFQIETNDAPITSQSNGKDPFRITINACFPLENAWTSRRVAR